MCTAQPPAGRGTWMCRVNPPRSLPSGAFCLSEGEEGLDEAQVRHISRMPDAHGEAVPQTRGTARRRVNPSRAIGHSLKTCP